MYCFSMKITINPKYNKFYSVDMDEVAIAPENVELETGGMSTCTALVAKGQGRNLLAHVSADSNLEGLKQALSKNFNLADPNLKIFIIPGAGEKYEDVSEDEWLTSDSTRDKVKKALNDLGSGLKDKTSILLGFYEAPYQSLFLDEDLYVSAHRFRKSEIVRKDDELYIIAETAHRNRVKDLGNGSVGVCGYHRLNNGRYTQVYKNAVIGKPRWDLQKDTRVGVYVRRDWSFE